MEKSNLGVVGELGPDTELPKRMDQVRLEFGVLPWKPEGRKR